MLRALLKHYFIADILKKATLSTLVVITIISFYSPLCSRKNHLPTFQSRSESQKHTENGDTEFQNYNNFKILVTQQSHKMFSNPQQAVLAPTTSKYP